MKRRLILAGLAVVAAVPLLAAGAGTMLSSGVLHPLRKPLGPGHVANADRMASRVSATRDDVEVKLDDGVVLRGWKFRPPKPNGDWVLAIHGVSDHRIGVIGHTEMLLRNGYGVLAMDMRAHGASDGDMATYGWLERHDVRQIADALFAAEQPHCFFLLGESMGAAIALQAAAAEPRVAGVVAESAFASLREISYDYAGLRVGAWLGRTLFRPAASSAISGVEKEGGFRADDVSPERAVAERAFPVLLICGKKDRNIPPRHTERIFKAARGPKELWLVPNTGHTMALGTAPQEFERRAITFYGRIHSAR